MRCVLCGGPVEGYGNNPAPLAEDGSACNGCNATKVIPARIAAMRQDQLIAAHEEEADKHGAEFYNLGWASGDDFIHSKTDKGRLYSEIDAKGKVTHEWQAA